MKRPCVPESDWQLLSGVDEVSIISDTTELGPVACSSWLQGCCVFRLLAEITIYLQALVTVYWTAHTVETGVGSMVKTVVTVTGS